MNNNIFISSIYLLVLLKINYVKKLSVIKRDYDRLQRL